MKVLLFQARTADLMVRRESPWLWASIKIGLNEFRVSVWHCINSLACRRGEQWLRANKTPITGDCLCMCCESACLSEYVFGVVLERVDAGQEMSLTKPGRN